MTERRRKCTRARRPARDGGDTCRPRRAPPPAGSRGRAPRAAGNRAGTERAPLGTAAGTEHHAPGSGHHTGYRDRQPDSSASGKTSYGNVCWVVGKGWWAVAFEQGILLGAGIGHWILANGWWAPVLGTGQQLPAPSARQQGEVPGTAVHQGPHTRSWVRAWIRIWIQVRVWIGSGLDRMWICIWIWVWT